MMTLQRDVGSRESQSVYDTLEGVDLEIALWAKGIIDEGGDVGEVIELLERATHILAAR